MSVKFGNKVLFVLSMILLLCGLTGCNKTQETNAKQGKVIVKLGYLPITHSLAMFETKEQLEKKEDDVQIQLQKFSTWPDLMDALNNGKIDGASVLAELAMSAKAKGVDLKIVDLAHKAGNAIVVSNKIKNIEGLKGKTFAIPSTQSSHYILLQDMLALKNMTIDDLNVIQLAPTEMAFSLASGAIDGYCVAEPFGAQVVSKKLGHVLYDSEELWEDSICCGFVMNQEFISKYPEEAKKVKEEYEAAGKLLDYDTAMEVARKYLGQEDKTLEQSLKWIHFDDLSLSHSDYNVLTDKVTKYGIMENPPAYEEMIYQP